jgi:Asp-tRNA(Asn)/Glu-tRNA(Gln) amidotransferase C subunit
VQRLASLAGLDFSDHELGQLTPQFKGLMQAVRRVRELDLGDGDLAVTFQLPEAP